MIKNAVFALALLAAVPLTLAAAPDTPDSYAARWPLQLPAAASLLRLPLPAGALTEAQTSDLRDLRIFNANGQPVPLALDRASPETTAFAPDPITLPALPIKMPLAAAAGDFSLHISDGPNGRVVDVASKGAGGAAGKAGLFGFLVDTREQKTPLQAIELDANWPEDRPFTFRLSTSSDLRRWQRLGEITVYRGRDGVLTGPPRLALDRFNLQSRYLRIDWGGEEESGIAPSAPDAVQLAVRLAAVRLIPALPQALPARLAVPLTLAAEASRDPRILEWRLPFATPVAALDIRLDGPAALIPVRLLARQQREQPWTPLARLVLFNLTRDGQSQHNPPLELGHAAWREWRIEAEPSSPGFTSPPQITVLLAPAQLVFVASGPPPFTLAAGRADAPATGLPLASLIPGYQPNAQNQLPTASLAATAPSSPVDRKSVV
jgi:hypothetical protein